MDRVTFCKRASEADSNVRAVIATEEGKSHPSSTHSPPLLADSLTNTSFHGSTPVATMVSDAQWPTHVTVRLYQPIEQTKMAQVGRKETATDSCGAHVENQQLAKHL